MSAEAQRSSSEFWEWFTAERSRRRLSVRAVEAWSGGNTGWLYKRISRGLPPTYETCRIIAEAFGLPVEEVLRRAGFLSEGEEPPEITELRNLAAALPPADLAALLTVARALVIARERRPGEPESYRVIGLKRRPWSLSDWRRGLEGLTPEERARLLADLAEEGFVDEEESARNDASPGSEDAGAPGDAGEAG